MQFGQLKVYAKVFEFQILFYKYLYKILMNLYIQFLFYTKTYKKIFIRRVCHFFCLHIFAQSFFIK